MIRGLPFIPPIERSTPADGPPLFLPLLLLLLFSSVWSSGQKNEAYPFEQIKFSEREVFSYVRSMSQDHHGFLWIGTNYGLFRFDGYNYREFKNDPDDPESLIDNFVETTLTDHRGRLWIGTESGLDLLDRKTGKFIHFRHDPADPGSLSHNRVTSLEEDQAGNIWVGTRNGLNLLDKDGTGFLHFYAGQSGPNGISGSHIRALEVDHAGNIWVGTYRSGLNRLEPIPEVGQLTDHRALRFTHFTHEPVDDPYIVHRLVNKLFVDRQGRLWISYSGGLFLFDREKETLRRVPVQPDAPFQTGGIWSFSDDREGNLWVGTHGSGLYWIPAAQMARGEIVLEKFAPGLDFFVRQSDAFQTYPFSRIWTIFEDRSGNLWMGGLQGLMRKQYYEPGFRQFRDPQYSGVRFDDHGIAEDQDSQLLFSNKLKHELLTLDPRTGHIRPIPVDPNHPPSEGIVFVSEIFVDRHNNLWLGTNDRGVYFITRKTGEIQRFATALRSPKPQSTTTGLIPQICEDSRGHIWIATWRDGLVRYQPETEAFNHFLPDPTDPHSIPANRVNTVYEDRRGEIWVGTYLGLSRFRRDEEQFENYFPDPARPGSLSHKRVTALFEDSRGNFWVGTEGGLNLMDREQKKFRNFLEKDGLVSDMINDMLEDSAGRVWLTTKLGISTFIPEQLTAPAFPGTDTSRERFRNYTHLDGLKSQSYVKGLLSSATGRIYLAGESGLEYFHPDSLRRDTMPPRVVITNFIRSRLDAGTPRTDCFIADRSALELSYRDSILSFEVAALHFQKTTKSRYKYQLQGFSDQWFSLGQNRTITFTDLDPGAYTLRVMGTNGDGVWSLQPAELSINILPPWWATSWAYGLYTLLLLVSVRAIWRYERRRHEMQSEARRLQELDTYKTRLYTNITHEFRTPLTIILGMVRQIRDDPRRWYHEGLAMIGRNGQQLLHLVNQMLDLSKLDKGRLELQLRRGDIVTYLQYLVQSFESYAAGRQVRLHFLRDMEQLEMDFDPDQLLKVISNLLSNAIKHTPAGGDIYLQLRMPQEKVLEISVRDTGEGIARADQPFVFDRFFRVSAEGSTPSDVHSPGAGIGLALTKELVELMGGSIRVQSCPGTGAEFRVELPVQRLPDSIGKSFTPDIGIFGKAPWSLGKSFEVNEEIPPVNSPEENGAIRPWTTGESPEKETILVIEDNRDVRTYLAACLEGDYQLELARNGQEGMELAFELVPDIIISDVMMPQKNGYEVCESLKRDVRTSHIPVILLTAKADREARLEGLESGADAYLAKPFDREELRVRIRKLLELRRQLQTRYQQPGSEEVVPALYPERENRFLADLRAVILEHLQDEHFGISQLCRAINLSRSQLHNKIKALTGHSTSIYIRHIRLERARELLLETNLNISEIAYEVGFRTPGYFTQAFTETVGMAPSQFRKVREGV
ncbi:hybrid sensor histidine kinase/response regulator transcription factor [Flavilitoribacter nigricans]|uniref:histidine kinase n=1 Tax=Flavilitoribacter nigricans (strain ATCC 23147 / DSM 23189 / NBRC 102662 / NCIMB 1420 / SS-2) TaxID=1122177 RepID=A0A2D0N1N8_FLAN2|nr:two-component regulator propeller domain-containing protein [Flavilitoribacter nigricans]PHN02286.1 hypothetical protein CRP01_32830 [Flavilitoribacter nigricans DSM 23189 = NBRC 102662]